MGGEGKEGERKGGEEVAPVQPPSFRILKPPLIDGHLYHGHIHITPVSCCSSSLTSRRVAVAVADTIEAHVTVAHDRVDEGREELMKAAAYQASRAMQRFCA